METNAILEYMHTHTEGAISMASSSEATRSSEQPDQFTQQLTGHSVNLLSITPNFTLSLSLLPFLSLLKIHFFCHEPEKLPFISREQGLAVLSRRGSRSSGDRGKEALQGSREILRDAAEPAPHARIQPPLSPPARAAAAAANRKGRGRKI